jgi:hypothetical protein
MLRMQDSVLYCRCLTHFPQCHPASAKDMLLFSISQICTSSLKHILPCLGTISFGRPAFTKLRAGELNRSHKDLNATDANTGLTELYMCMWEFKIFVFEVSFVFKIYYYYSPHLVKRHVINMQIR